MAGGDAALVPTGREMKSYAPLRSLGRRGIHTIVASERERLPHFSSRYCSERVSLPSPTADLAGYRDALLEVAARPAVKTAYPVRECDAYLFAKYRDAFEEHLSLVAPDLDTLRRGHDRLRLARAAEAAGVPYAETRPLSAVDAWDRPGVVKSRYNVLTGDYVDAYPDGELEEVKRVQTLAAGEEPDAEALYAEMNHEPIVQDFVPQADKHLYCALWDEGEPLATYQHRQLRQNSWVGGGGVYRVSAYSQAVEDAAFDLLSHLDWHGFACIEYVQDADTGEWKFLEINPRLWQSLPEAVRAGVDFPHHYWRRARGDPGPFDDDYETGRHCHIAYGEVAHLLSLFRDDSPLVERPSAVRTLWDVVSSCVVHPRFDYIRRDDPRLFLSALRETTSTGVTQSRQFAGADAPARPAPSTDGGRPEDDEKR
jgi:predicted ATP-grasp superfamily ATP-dependent carboligase